MYSASGGFADSKMRLWTQPTGYVGDQSAPGWQPTDWPLGVPMRKHDNSGDAGVPRTPEFPGGAPSELHEFLVGGPEVSPKAAAAAKGDGVRPGRSHKSPAWWMAEILSLLFGVVCMAVVAVVLSRADGNPPPQWPAGITLNTFVAFFTSMARAAFMMPIVEGLGQLKWMWFLGPEPRPLLDFQTFDEASRGSWGSFQLLIRFKGFLACLGAVITLSGFLTSTVTQQAILYPVISSESADGISTVARATSFSLYNGTTLVLAPHDTTREKLSIVNGAFFVPNETVPHTTPVCSSGECSWPAYGSLAVCSEVVNLTAQGNETLLASLRNTTSSRLALLFNSTLSMLDDISSGRRLRVLPASFPLLIGPVAQPTGALNGSVVDLVINDQYVAYSDSIMTVAGGGNSSRGRPDVSQLKFLEIAFFFCTKTLETRVVKGVPSTTEVGVRAEGKNSSPYPLNFGWNGVIYDCYVLGTCNATLGGLEIEMEPPPGLADPERFTVDVWTGVVASSLIFATMYDAVLVDSMRGLVFSSGGGVGQAFAPSLFGDFPTFASPTPDAQLAGVKNIARNMAQSMTNLVREGSTSQTNHNGVRSSSALLRGTVFTPQTFVQIRWGYVAMLASQLGLTSLFLVATIAETWHAGVQVLKGSSLAALCGLDGDTRAALGGINAFETLRERARITRVRLERRTAQAERGRGPALWLSASMWRRPLLTTRAAARPSLSRPTTSGTATSWGSSSLPHGWTGGDAGVDVGRGAKWPFRRIFVSGNAAATR